MYFKKINTIENFRFEKSDENYKKNPQKKSFKKQITPLGANIFKIQIDSQLWKGHQSQAILSENLFRNQPSLYKCDFSDKEFKIYRGKTVLLKSLPEKTFGTCGKKWIFPFEYRKNYKFYGLGEKNNGFEKTGVVTKFWNTDVFADFASSDIQNGITDPMYVSIPYLLIDTGSHWLGILINNPYPVFMALGSSMGINYERQTKLKNQFYIGSTDGQPEIYFIAGRGAADVTRKLQTLVGPTPRPPLWALGHHQCRWGYESYQTLDRIDKKFKEHKIPNDGLWLDIDYMDKFKIFTFHKNHFFNPSKQILNLKKRGQHVVPIIDPGVKKEDGYLVYDEGYQNELFCKNSEAFPYTGFVWPGKTVFPDFSLKKTRSWWASKIADFISLGISGIWIDMNDPSTGSSELDEMRFQNGRFGHEMFHNQYGYAMAQASYEGFLKADSQKRPFILSRSGFISSSRFSAVWTGDNISNYHHLKNSIGVTLNLSLSGIPFNGPDVPGFGGEPDDELAVKWYQAAFLFPFLRNHSVKNMRFQEPWTFSKKAFKIIRNFIRLRYKFLPYLYNLFINQEECGDPILRPLFYEFKMKKNSDVTNLAEEFTVGPAILQTPVLYKENLPFSKTKTKKLKNRKIFLPKDKWYDPVQCTFIEGDRNINISLSKSLTPLFFRDGHFIPLQKGIRKDNQNNIRSIDMVLFLSESFTKKAVYKYTLDDGLTFDYKKNTQSTFLFTAQRNKKQNEDIEIHVKSLQTKAGEIDVNFFIFGKTRSIMIKGGKPDLKNEITERNPVEKNIKKKSVKPFDPFPASPDYISRKWIF